MSKLPIKALMPYITLLGIVFSVWFFFNDHFALAEDLNNYQITTEQSMLEMQMDTVEDRLDRAKKENDQDKIDKLNRRLNRLEDRQDFLEEIEIKKLQE